MCACTFVCWDKILIPIQTFQKNALLIEPEITDNATDFLFHLGFMPTQNYFTILSRVNYKAQNHQEKQIVPS